MKKTFLFLISVMAALNAAATDRFYIEDFIISPGETKQVSIMLDNEEQYSAFQVDLLLPEGLTVEMDNGEYTFNLTSRKDNDHTILSMMHEDGSFRIIAYSLNVKSFKGNSGALVTFNLSADDNFKGPAPILLKNMRFTTPQGVEIPFQNETTIVYSESISTMLGDVNNDGNVSISDVTELIDYLLSGDNASINMTAADFDENGYISIDDVVLLIDMLLTGSTPTYFREIYAVNGVLFTMIRVPAGTFMMGATPEQGENFVGWERPVHEVTLSSYCIGETEVTQELWLAVMGSNPSFIIGDLQRPVDNVTWLDCQEFIAQLNALTGRNFRLPTEAEWEYAARGGNRSRGYKYAGSDSINDVGWCSVNIPAESIGPDGLGTTQRVATKAPNELYLYDMSGNVEEWTNDYWSFYTSTPQTNPTGPETGTTRVYRGGSWYESETTCRVSFRMHRAESFHRSTMGLRLAL